MQEQDLFEAYNERLKFYQKKFNRDRIFPFTETKIESGDKKEISADIFFNMYNYDLILIPSNYLVIIDKICDFAALSSFLPAKFRSDYLFKLLFLLHFKNCGNPLIKNLWDDINKYVSEMMIKIGGSDYPLHIYLKDITLPDLLFKFTPKINPIYMEDVFFSVFINWLKVAYSKKINIGTLRYVMTTVSDLHSFDDFISGTARIFDNYSIPIPLIIRNYPKIGLSYFLIIIKFLNLKKSQNILENYFYKIPFFSHFVYLNHTCYFYCFIPHHNKKALFKYLKRLQNSNIIGVFFIDQIIESNFKLEFENTLNRDQIIFYFFPFKSKKFRENKSIPPNLRSLPNFALVKHQLIYPKPNIKIDSAVNALDFFIFFFIENLLMDNESYHSLVEKNVLISSLRALNSKQIRKNYNLLSKDNLIQENKKKTIIEFGKILREKYPEKKTIEKLITLFKVLKISDTSELTENFFDKHLLKIGNEFNKFFLKKSDHSKIEIKSRFDILFEEGYLKKTGYYFPFIKMNPTVTNLKVTAKSNIEITKCLFFNYKWMGKNSNTLDFFLTSDTYLLFSKFLLQDNLISIGIPYIFASSNIGFDAVSYFDFEKRDWNEKKIDNYFHIFYKEIPNQRITSHYKINLNKWEEKLPAFNWSDFYRDLRYFNKLNKISKKSRIYRREVIKFFKNYIENQQINFNLITEEFNFKVKKSKFPTTEKKKRIFIIISQPGTNINPFILKKTRIFSLLFSKYLQNGWYYGGSLDNILILEYLIESEDLKNKESEWNVGIDAIKIKYPRLNLRIFELLKDLRFFNEQSLYSMEWYYDDFNYLKQTSDLELDNLEVKNEFSYIFNSEFKYKEYHPHFLPWEFWHVIDYPVSVSIIVECPEEPIKSINNIIKRLPAGQIFTFKKIGGKKNLTLLTIVQLKNNIDRFFENIIPLLNRIDCKYSISLIVPLTLWEVTFIVNK